MRGFAMGFLFGLLILSVAYAATINQVYNAVFDDTNDALRVNDVSP